MESPQSSTGSNLTETTVQPQQASSKNNLFFVVVISVLLTAIISGSVVYFWQKSANERAINSLEQRFISLEQQISKVKNEEAVTQPISPPASSPTSTSPSEADETIDWKTYENEVLGYKFKYPQDWLLQSRQPDSAAGMIDNITFEVAGNDRLTVRFSTYQNSKTAGETAEDHLQYYRSLAESSGSDGPTMTVSSVDKPINNNIEGIEILIGGVDVGKRVVFDKDKILFVFSPSIMAMSPDEQSEIEATLDQVFATFEFAD